MDYGDVRVLGDLKAGVFQKIFDRYITPCDDSYTKLLMHFNGSDGATSFKDASGTNKVITASGGAQISQVNGSGYFDGNSDYLSLADSDDWNFSNGNFTIECWIRLNNISNTQYIFSHETNALNRWTLYYTSGGFAFTEVISGTPTVIVSATYSPTINTWYHIAVVRNGTDWRIYINGSSVGNSTLSRTLGDFGLLYIGAYWTNSSNYFDGYLDELRISKGIARWTSNFTPQTTRYEKDSYTKLLISFDGRDSSTSIYDDTGKAITAYGTAQIDTAQYKVDGQKFGNAGFFDGSGDYLTLTDSADYTFGSGDFTIDCWVKLNTLGSEQYFHQQYTDGNNRLEWGFSNSLGLFCIFRSSGTVYVYIYQNNTTGWVAGKWHHVAFIRSGNNWNLYLDGTSVASTTSSQSVNDFSTHIVGSYMGSSSYLNGWIDEFRVLKGRAKWTSNFTSPTTQSVGDDIETSIAISGLDGDTDKIYLISIELVNSYNGSINYYLKPNNDGSAVYGFNRIYGSNASAGSSKSTGLTVGFQLESLSAMGRVALIKNLLYAKSGYLRTMFTNGNDDITGTTITSVHLFGQSYNNTGTNITSLVIYGDQNTGIGQGSRIEIYRRLNAS
jgi:hypothetical protein